MKPTELKEPPKFKLKEVSLLLFLLLIKNPLKLEKPPLKLGSQESCPTLKLHSKEIKDIMPT